MRGSVVELEDTLDVSNDGWCGAHIREIKESDAVKDAARSNTIPKVIHFVYGMRTQDTPFEEYKCRAIVSANRMIAPHKIYFWYHNEPYGPHWDACKALVTLVRVRVPTHIFNNKLHHYAHISDAVRMRVLVECGGIYLDIDTITLKSFDPLLHHDCVLGTQDSQHLPNAIMLCKPNAAFVKRWFQEYKTFRGVGRKKHWDEHSVKLPMKLYLKDKRLVHALPTTAFYPIHWSNINLLFKKKTPLTERLVKDTYCVHLFESKCEDELEAPSPESLIVSLWNQIES
jgi:hypothetical protein